MLDFILMTRKLMNIQRCPTSRKLRPEDVAQHSYYVALLAMLIADELNAFDENYNIGLVLQKALLHDMEETITGDIIWPVKHHSPALEEELDKVTDSLVYKEFEKFRNSNLDAYKLLMFSAKQGREGQVVALADNLELVLYCFEELSLSNRQIADVYEQAFSNTVACELYKSSPLAQKILYETRYQLEKTGAYL